MFNKYTKYLMIKTKWKQNDREIMNENGKSEKCLQSVFFAQLKQSFELKS